jgi:DNA topoisomerase-1
MKSLTHNGILVIHPPEPHNLTIRVRGKDQTLNPLQEEMAIAWVRKLGTPYVEDSVFARNFLADFSKELHTKPSLKLDEVDFTPVIRFVEEDRIRKQNMTGEEKKVDREHRKGERERLKQLYGYATVDSQVMELANYMTEPSGIFMGRGQHPLRGRWKHGALESDITLNLDPRSPRPKGDWGEITWAPDCMWIAKWTDKLTGNGKYIWLHDATPIKQEREEAKFDKALKMEAKREEIHAHIMDGLHSTDPKRREIAAACYLIDMLSLRVGDEKDPDEADTVGATTLRAEHLAFKKDSVLFDFLGKDSVPWHKELEMSPDVYAVFKELYDKAVERVNSFKTRASSKTDGDSKKVAQVFSRVRSADVNKFLGEIDPDLTAKVFRTLRATVTIRDELGGSGVKRSDMDFIKRTAFKRANLEVARVMNHTKQAPKGWPATAKRYESRIKAAEERVTKAKKQLDEKKRRLNDVKKKQASALAKAEELVSRQKQTVEKYKESVSRWRERRDKAKIAWDNARDERHHTRVSKRKGKTTKKERLEEAEGRIERTKLRLDKAEEGLAKARERYEKSRAALEKRMAVLASSKQKSAEQIARVEKTVTPFKERAKRADAVKQKLQADYDIAKTTRAWNLGTSLKSYIHPRVVYDWCRKVDMDWRSVYSKTLQRKFTWVEQRSS